MKARPAPAGPAPTAAPPPRPRITHPTVTRAITWDGPILGDEVAFVRSQTTGKLKVTVIGPVTLAFRLVDQHYGSFGALCYGLADALNREILHLETLGVDLVQIDEPEVHFRYSACHEVAVEAISRAVRGVSIPTAVHMCYGYSKNIAEKRESSVYAKALTLLASTPCDEISIEYEQPGHGPELLTHAGDKAVILGVLNLDTEAPVETVEHITTRARAAAEAIGRDRLRLAPDCGMWFLPRAVALAKITNMAEAAASL